MAPEQRAARLHNDGVAEFRRGRFDAARSRFLDAVGTIGADRISCGTLKALWHAAARCGDWSTALAAGFAAGKRDPLDFAFVDSVVRSLHDCPPDALPRSMEPAIGLPERLPTLSVVIPSRDEAHFAMAQAEYARAFARWPHRCIAIVGARSMYEAWSRGFEQSDGEVVIFSHEDIAFAVPDFAARLADALRHADVVGVAGATRVGGPALLWSGHPFLHGAIVHRTDAPATPYELGLLSLHGPRVEEAQALDGVFIACRRACIERVGFDVAGIPGFHFYDLDFTFRARRLGARVTIACDLALMHASRGRIDDAWHLAQSAFAAKFPMLAEPQGAARHWYALKLADERAVAAIYRKLFAAWALRLP